MSIPYDTYPLVLQVIDRLTDGYTETRACDLVGLSIQSFKNSIKDNDDLQALYDEAMQRGYDAMAEALLSPDNHAIYGHSDPKMAKVQSDNIKFFLERRDAKRYGQRVEVNHTLTADKAITQALAAARMRTLPAPDVIDITPTHVPAEDDEAILAELFAD